MAAQHDALDMKSHNPESARYFEAIAARPAVKAALAKVGQIKSNRDKPPTIRRTASSTAANTPAHNAAILSRMREEGLFIFSAYIAI